jgi:hypothetical protein
LRAATPADRSRQRRDEALAILRSVQSEHTAWLDYFAQQGVNFRGWLLPPGAAVPGDYPAVLASLQQHHAQRAADLEQVIAFVAVPPPRAS